jgi:hypothetical protein
LAHAWVECFGIRLDKPVIETFKGGIKASDTYEKTKANEEACQ